MLKITQIDHVSSYTLKTSGTPIEAYQVKTKTYQALTFAEALEIYDPFQTDHIEHNFTLEDYVLCFGTNLSIQPKGSGK